MDGSQPGRTKVTMMGLAEVQEGEGPAVVSLRAALERTVQAHRLPGLRIREVVVLLEEGPPAPEPTPVYVDVYDSGDGHGI